MRFSSLVRPARLGLLGWLALPLGAGAPAAALAQPPANHVVTLPGAPVTPPLPPNTFNLDLVHDDPLAPTPPDRRALRITKEELIFTDAQGVLWTAPAKTITDGASIPQVALILTGDPWAPEFIRAAIVHDAYCAQDNKGKPPHYTREWQSVHWMFCEALIAGGTPAVKAKLMYAAVYLFGPRKWTVRHKFKGGGQQSSRYADLEKMDLKLQEVENELSDTSPASPEQHKQQFAELQRVIEAENPDRAELDALLQTAAFSLHEKQVYTIPARDKR